MTTFYRKFLSRIIVLASIVYFIIERRLPAQDIVFLNIILIIYSLEKKNVFSKFLHDWAPVMIFIFCYEFLRGHAYIFHKLLKIQVHKTELLEIEKLFFGNPIPTIIMQRMAQITPTSLDVLFIIIYSSFFWGAISIGIILWFKSYNFFKVFRNGYLLLCFMGLFTYILYPAYPPWMASQEGYLPILERSAWEKLQMGKFLSIVFDKVGYNPVAPMPSLHAGWALYSSIMFDMFFKKWWSKLIYSYPLLMGTFIVYSGDHYVVDIIAGFAYAILAVLLLKITGFMKSSDHSKSTDISRS